PSPPSRAAEVVLQHVAGDAAQPGREGGLRRVERADAADGDEPGFLHHLVGVLAQAAAAPQDVRVKTVEGFVVPRAPRLLVAGQDGGAEAPLAPDAIRRVHGGPRSPRSYCPGGGESFVAVRW